MGPDTVLLVIEELAIQALGLTMFCIAGYYVTKNQLRALQKKKAKSSALSDKI